MKDSHVLGNSSTPLRVFHKVLPVIKEILDLNRGQTEEQPSLFQRACDPKNRTLEVIHPMQAEKAKGHIELFNVFELGLNIDLLEVNLRLERVVVLIEVDHILRNIIANYPLDLDSVLQQSFPNCGRGEAISAANIEDGKWLLLLLVLLGDGFNEVIDSFFVEVALKMVYLWIGPIEALLLSVELQDLINCLIQQSPVDFLWSFLILLSIAAWVVQALQKSTQHKICDNYYKKKFGPMRQMGASIPKKCKDNDIFGKYMDQRCLCRLFWRFSLSFAVQHIFSYLEISKNADIGSKIEVQKCDSQAKSSPSNCLQSDNSLQSLPNTQNAHSFFKLSISFPFIKKTTLKKTKKPLGIRLMFL